MNATQKKIGYLVLSFCTAMLLASLTTSYTTDLPIIKDAMQNVDAAYSLNTWRGDFDRWYEAFDAARAIADYRYRDTSPSTSRFCRTLYGR